MTTKCLLSGYDLASEEVVIDSNHIFFAGDRDEFAVRRHVHIGRFLVRDAKLFTHERYIRLVALWVDSQYL